MANAIVATAITGITVAVVLSLGYVLVPMVVSNLPTPTLINGSVDTDALTGISDAKTIVFAGFALMAVSIIVLAAFFIISIFQS